MNELMVHAESRNALIRKISFWVVEKFVASWKKTRIEIQLHEAQISRTFVQNNQKKIANHLDRKFTPNKSIVSGCHGFNLGSGQVKLGLSLFDDWFIQSWNYWHSCGNKKDAQLVKGPFKAFLTHFKKSNSSIHTQWKTASQKSASGSKNDVYPCRV